MPETRDSDVGHTALHRDGNRLFDDEGRELAVATRADPSLRPFAAQTAAEIERRWNHHAALVEALRAARTVMAQQPETADSDIELARRSALRFVGEVLDAVDSQERTASA